MRKVRLIRSLDGGLEFSLSPEVLRDSQSPWLKNIEFYNGAVQKNRRFVEFDGHVFPEAVTFIDQFFCTDGSSFLFAYTPNHIYKYISAGSWEEVTPTGVSWGASILDRWSSVQFPYTDGGGTFHDAYIATNFLSGILKWEKGDSQFAILSGTENFKGVALGVYHNHLFVGRIEEGGELKPYRIRWSDTGNAEVWDSGNAGYIDLIETADWVVGFALLRGILYVFKERSIWRVYYRGTSERPFEFEIVSDGIGARAPDAIVPIGDYIIFLSWDNIYAFDGVRTVPIGDAIQPRTFGPNGQLQDDKSDAFWSIFIEERSELWNFLVETGRETPNICYTYNTALRAWSIIQKGFCGGGYFFEEAGSLIWDNADFTWDEARFPWISQNLAGSRAITLFGGADGKIYKLDFLPCLDEAIFRTKDFVFEVPQRLWSVRALGEGTVEMAYSLDGGTTWHGRKTFTPGSTASWLRLPVNRVSSSIMIEFRIPENESGRIYQLEIETSPRQRLG